MDKFITRKRRQPYQDAQTDNDQIEYAVEKKSRNASPVTDHNTQIHTQAAPQWKKIQAENLDLDYCILLSKEESGKLFQKCEEELEYNTGRIAQVQLFGKWIDIPRKQVSPPRSQHLYFFPGISSNNS